MTTTTSPVERITLKLPIASVSTLLLALDDYADAQRWKAECGNPNFDAEVHAEQARDTQQLCDMIGAQISETTPR